jgi:hypothetical protein
MATTWHLKHEEFGDKPWDVQAEAMRRAEGHRYYGWWMEMGLGKTALSLNHAVDLYRKGEIDICVVVCPFSFTDDWASAPPEWGVPWVKGCVWNKKTPVVVNDLNGWSSVDAGLLHGAPREPFRLVAVGFETAKTSARAWLRTVTKQHRVLLVLDESSAIANPSANLTTFLLDLRKGCPYAVELNGTPYTGKVTNYWGQLKFVGALDGVNPFSFRNRFARMGGYMGKKEVGIKNEEELYRLIDAHAFRALKADWRKSLPPKVNKDVMLSMTPRQLTCYSDMRSDFYATSRGFEVQAELVLTQMDKMRQISSCLMMQNGEFSWIEPPENNPKVAALNNLLEAATGKVIVTHFYKPSGQMLIEHLRDHGVDPAYIRGQMKPAELTEQKRRFNEDPTCQVIVCQQGAAFRGHTLLGGKGPDRCSTNVFFENDFSYYQRAQMEDRNHRGAQDTMCVNYNLVTSKVEQKMLTAVRTKQATAGVIDSFVTAMREDGAPIRKAAKTKQPVMA